MNPKTEALFHINNAKRRLEEAERLVRSSPDHGAFSLLSYCKHEIMKAMEYIPVADLDWQAAFIQDYSNRGSKRMAGERSGL